MARQQKLLIAEFPYRLKHATATLHFRTQLSAAARVEVEQMITGPAKGRRISAPLGNPQNAIFAKQEQLDSLRQRFRVHTGRLRRNGMYDWPVEELRNTAEAFKRGAPVAGLMGFGYGRSKVGLVDRLFLFTPLLGKHVNGLSWIEAYPREARQFARAAFELIRSLHAQGIAHMDLWAANVMMPTVEGDTVLAIDLENSFSIPTRFLSETLGFQFGFIYHRELYRYITEADYDALVSEALDGFANVDRQRFWQTYVVCKHEHVGRLERREIFLKGRIGG